MILFLAAVSCASPGKAPEREPAQEIQKTIEGVELKAWSSAGAPRHAGADATVTNAVSDGSIVTFEAKVPKEFAGAELTGKFEALEFPFYADDESGSLFGAVLGVPYEHKPGPSAIEVHLKKGELTKTLSFPFTIVAGDYPSETIKVQGKYVEPPKKVMARIKREQAEIGAIYRNVTAKKHWKGAFLLPTDKPIGSIFGTRRVFNGVKQTAHLGTDLRAPTGTPVHAPAGGVVALAKNLYFTGNTVMIDHGYGVVTFYGHLSKIKVKKGAIVTPGMLLGLSGATGRVSGPHLHWGAVVHREKVNPVDLTKVMR